MADHENNPKRFDAFLRHIVDTAPVPPLPENFAQEMASQVRDHTEEAGFESWLLRALLVIAVIAAVGFMIPSATSATTRIHGLLGDAPWPLLLTVAVVFSGMKLAEMARPPLSVHRET